MTNSEIIESGMTFGPFSEGHCFYIEKSDTYQKIQDGVKMAEFLLLRVKNDAAEILIVEAKSSSPQPGTQPNFNEFIGEIREKMVNGLSLGIASLLKRHETAAAELPNPFKKLDLSSMDFRFILIVKGHEDAWLDPVKDALSEALRSTVKTWALSPSAVKVYNDKFAREKGLIR